MPVGSRSDTCRAADAVGELASGSDSKHVLYLDGDIMERSFDFDMEMELDKDLQVLVQLEGIGNKQIERQSINNLTLNTYDKS